jgi:hypothetical protein
VALGAASAHADGSVSTIRIPGGESEDDPRGGYFRELLALALDRTVESHGPYRIEPSPIGMLVHGRGVRLLEDGVHIDLLYTMTSLELERRLLPVRVPLLRGMLGWRVFLVREGEQARFDAVRTLEDLSALVAGQGHRWPDVDILRHAGLPVEVGRSYGGLFEMLRKGRFDYFPRGVTEIGAELAVHEGEGLVAETSLLLVYPTALYFFVRRDNAPLAARLEEGLRAAIADGAFDRLYVRYFAEAVAAVRLADRRVLRLANPVLPPETPLNDASLWYRTPE